MKRFAEFMVKPRFSVFLLFMSVCIATALQAGEYPWAALFLAFAIFGELA